MLKLNRVIDFLLGSQDLSDLKSSKLKDILNGEIWQKSFFKNQYKFFGLFVIIAFLNISNRYWAEGRLAHELDLKKKLVDVKYISLTSSAELIRLSRESNLLELLKSKSIDLEIPIVAPVEIKDSIE